MATKKRNQVKKKVTFSDDNTMVRQTHRKKNVGHEHPPVYVRKNIMIIPWHLLVLLYWYLYVALDYPTDKLLYALIPTQLLYLIFQFNQYTVYGNKIIKLNVPLVFISMGCTILLSIPALVLIILFGAPFLEKLKESLLLALHCCFLAYPAMYSVFNCDFKVGLWKKYFITIVVGAWLSCVVIPLDWDRPWQAWPVPALSLIHI